MDEDGTLLDDSRKWTQPMELVLGKKFKMEAWETCVQTMKINEVSSFKVKKQVRSKLPEAVLALSIFLAVRHILLIAS